MRPPRPRSILIVAITTLCAAWLLFKQGRSRARLDIGAARGQATVAPARDREPLGESGSTSERNAARVRRDALRESILRALAARPATAAKGPAPERPEEAMPGPPGDLVDRIGGRGALARALNQDFMPLAHQCIEQARRRTPSLSGVLALGIETLADAEHGAVVERADAAPDNSVADPELMECVRESALSLRLPPPPAAGRENFMVTLRLDPEPAIAVPSTSSPTPSAPVRRP